MTILKLKHIFSRLYLCEIHIVNNYFAANCHVGKQLISWWVGMWTILKMKNDNKNLRKSWVELINDIYNFFSGEF